MSESWRSAELEKAPLNGRVGHTLVSETDAVRVWVISLKPGERLAYHCHVLNYFWTATSAGTTRSQFSDGTSAESSVKVGDTRHYNFAAGERMIHDLENIGATPVSYVTVELKIGSANTPLALA
jgi:uncharacterized cupin superfamily protein